VTTDSENVTVGQRADLLARHEEIADGYAARPSGLAGFEIVAVGEVIVAQPFLEVKPEGPHEPEYQIIKSLDNAGFSRADK
jgi:hypothetical protein